METGMRTHLDLWQQDHHNYRRLLDLLQSQVKEFSSGGSPDYEVMLEVLHYMTAGPDKLHHVHEDIAYSLVALKEPTLSSVVSTLEEQHRAIVASGLRLVVGLSAIVDGSIVTRESINEQAQTYVSHLQEHLKLEEIKLFPALRIHTECLAPLPPVGSIADPLTDPKNSERYGAVRACLQRPS